MKFIGERLKMVRNLRGWGQQTLAEKAGVSQSSVNDWEKGKKQPRAEKVAKLCNALSIKDERYFYDIDVKIPTEMIPDIPEEIVKFILSLESLPYLEITEKAKRDGISPEAIKSLIDALRDSMTR